MMSTVTAPNGLTFRVERDRMEVTSMSRPDTSWRFVDASGHEHRWYALDKDRICEACTAGFRLEADGLHYDQAGLTWGVCRTQSPVPATGYNPSHKYVTPSLVWIFDGQEYWEDSDEPHDVGHLECRQCGEHVSPGYCADSSQQYIAGIACYYINDELASKDDFEHRLRLAFPEYKG